MLAWSPAFYKQDAGLPIVVDFGQSLRLKRRGAKGVYSTVHSARPGMIPLEACTTEFVFIAECLVALLEAIALEPGLSVVSWALDALRHGATLHYLLWRAGTAFGPAFSA